MVEIGSATTGLAACLHEGATLCLLYHIFPAPRAERRWSHNPRAQRMAAVLHDSAAVGELTDVTATFFFRGESGRVVCATRLLEAVLRGPAQPALAWPAWQEPPVACWGPPAALKCGAVPVGRPLLAAASAEFLRSDVRVQPGLDPAGALGDVGWYWCALPPCTRGACPAGADPAV